MTAFVRIKRKIHSTCNISNKNAFIPFLCCLWGSIRQYCKLPTIILQTPYAKIITTHGTVTLHIHYEKRNYLDGRSRLGTVSQLFLSSFLLFSVNTLICSLWSILTKLAQNSYWMLPFITALIAFIFTRYCLFLMFYRFM